MAQGGLGMPEAIQLLPLYSMALQKSVALRGGAEVRTHERRDILVLARLINRVVSSEAAYN